MRELTREELQAYLNKVIVRALRLHRQAALTYILARDTGCRFSELLYVQEWEFSNNGLQLQYIAQKTKQIRTINATLLSHQSAMIVANAGATIRNINYARARRLFMEITSSRPLYTENKRLQLHAFRHLYARNLYHQTRDIEYVKEDMGLRNKQTAQNYIFSPIIIK